MAISLHSGFWSAAQCKDFLSVLSDTKGWTFSDHTISKGMTGTEPIFQSAQKFVSVPAENRVATVGTAVVAFRKYMGHYSDPGSRILVFVEGNWRIQCNGRTYNFRPGDLAIANATFNLDSTGRGTRWCFATQSVRDFGQPVSLVFQALSGNVEDGTTQITIVGEQEDSDSASIDLEEDGSFDLEEEDDEDDEAKSFDLSETPPGERAESPTPETSAAESGPVDSEEKSGTEEAI
jgi:hypothetical protein